MAALIIRFSLSLLAKDGLRSSVTSCTNLVVSTGLTSLTSFLSFSFACSMSSLVAASLASSLANFFRAFSSLRSCLADLVKVSLTVSSSATICSSSSMLSTAYSVFLKTTSISGLSRISFCKASRSTMYEFLASSSSTIFLLFKTKLALVTSSGLSFSSTSMAKVSSHSFTKGRSAGISGASSISMYFVGVV